jgi:4-amino-4-deoxy-L-arabinose transferase-like glycosyltransferase
VIARPVSPEGSKRLPEAALLLLLTLTGALLLYIPRDRAPLNFDSSAYSAQSINIALGRGNTMRMGGEDIPGFYPPGYPALTAPFHWLFGVHLQNAVLTNFFMGLLTLLAVYFIGRSIAGPAAGTMALLLLLSSMVFRHVGQRIYSQMPSLFFLALAAVFIIEGWKSGRYSPLFRFAAGFVSGMVVLIRSNNVVLAPALALLPLLSPPVGRRKLEGALALWAGIAVSAALVVVYNLVEYGSPLATGYMSWGFSLEKVFSFEYIFNPLHIQMDERPYQLLRSLTGFGLLYSWPVAALAIPGCAAAFALRRKKPAFWCMCLFTVLSTLFLYVFLALYFFRSPIYTMLTLPLIAAVASSAAVLFIRTFQNPAWLKLLEQQVPPEMNAFREAAALIEPDAVVLGAANPLVGEYMLVRDTARKYVFLNRRQGEQFRRLILNELGSSSVNMPIIERYVIKRLQEGASIYLLIFPFEGKEAALLQETYTFINKRFKLEETKMSGLRRIRNRPGAGGGGR